MTSRKRHQCPTCGQEFGTYKAWALHMAGHLEPAQEPPQMEPYNAKPVKCRICGAAVTGMDAYEKHLCEEHDAPDHYLEVTLHAPLDDMKPWWCGDTQASFGPADEFDMAPPAGRIVDVDDLEGPTFCGKCTFSVPMWMDKPSDKHVKASLECAGAMVERAKEAMGKHIDETIARLQKLKDVVNGTTPVFKSTDRAGEIDVDLTVTCTKETNEQRTD